MNKYIIILMACVISPVVQAQELVYEPINPSFGGNSFNSAHLLAIANAQNDFEPPAVEVSGQSDLDRFVRSLQSRLLSSLSTQVSNVIFGEDAQDEGRIVFGDQTVEFVRNLDGVALTITEADGSQTAITIPILTTDDSLNAATKPRAAISSQSLTAEGSDILFKSQIIKSGGNSTLNSEPLLSQTMPTPIR